MKIKVYAKKIGDDYEVTVDIPEGEVLQLVHAVMEAITTPK